MGKSQLEGTAFLADGDNLPPYFQLHFFSLMYEPEFINLYIDLLNYDRKVIQVAQIAFFFNSKIYIIKMYFLEQKLSQFLIVINVMTAQVNCGLKEDDMPYRKIKTPILCCVYVCVFVYIFILYSSIQMENEKNFKALQTEI